MENNKKKSPWYRTPKGWLIIFLIALAFTIFRFLMDEMRRDSGPPEEITIESDLSASIPGFDLYVSEINEFQVLLPEDPEITTFELEGYPFTHYKSIYYPDDSLVQYGITYMDSDIYSEESIDAYLAKYTESKAIGAGRNSELATNDATQYKGFPARKYLIEYISEGVKIINEGIAFVANGDAIDLSVSYEQGSGWDAYRYYFFDEFIASFGDQPNEGYGGYSDNQNEKTVDLDNDGLTNEEEIKYGTDQNNYDSDGDGHSDGDEVNNGYNPLGGGALNR